MKKSTKIWICITGVLLVILGVVCIAHPAGTLFSAAWLIGLLTLFSGIAELVFTLNTQRYLPNSGTRMLSALMQIILGCIFLGHNLFLAASLPVIFAAWIMIEGIIMAVRSTDYKSVGFKYWWVILVLGLASAVLGFLGLRNPEAAGRTLSVLIGIGIILYGLSNIIGIAALSRFEKKIKNKIDAAYEKLDNLRETLENIDLQEVSEDIRQKVEDLRASLEDQYQNE